MVNMILHVCCDCSHLLGAQVLAKVTAAAVVPAVAASQTLTSYSVDTFTPDVQQQVCATLQQL